MKKTTLFLLTILLAWGTCFAQLDRSKRPEPGPAPEIKLGDFQKFELNNGLKVFVVENNKLPKITLRLIIDRDPILEKDNAGYVSIAGSLLRTGTKTRTKDQIDEEIDFIGASLETSASSVFASSLTKHRDKLLELMSDIVLNPVFKQEELDKIKKQTLSALEVEKDDPTSIANRVRKALVYGKDHPYGEMPTEKTVESINLEMCNNYYNTYFKPNAAYLAIVGDINFDDAKVMVEKYFGAWEKSEVPSYEYTSPKAPLVRKVAMVDRPASVQSVINITYPLNLKKNSEDVIKASVMNTILGGSFSSRLNQNLREDKGFTYGAGSSIASDELVGNFDASCEARNSVTDSVITEFLSELKRMRVEKVSVDELESRKNYISGSFGRSLENPQTIANFAIDTERFKLPGDYYKNYLKNLDAVTVDDISDMAKKYIKPDNAYIVVVGNAEEVADKLSKFSLNGKINYYDIYGDEYDPSLSVIPEGITFDKILEDYASAIGGSDNIMSVQDKTTKLKGMIQGMNLEVTISQKAPNKLYQLVDFGVGQQKTVFDGERGIQSGMGQERELTGEALEMVKIDADMFAYLNYDKYGVKGEVKGVENLDGVEAYKVELILSSGKKITQYFDVNSKFLIQQVSSMSSPQGSFTQSINFSDYKEVNGVKYPHKLSQKIGPQSIDLEVSSIEINTGIDDNLFKIN